MINAGAVVWAEGAPPLQELMPAQGVFSLIWVLIALPLLGAVVLLLGGRRTNRWGPYLAVLTVTASAVLGISRGARPIREALRESAADLRAAARAVCTLRS